MGMIPSPPPLPGPDVPVVRPQTALARVLAAAGQRPLTPGEWELLRLARVVLLRGGVVL
jgi:hypothetical protein